MYSVQFACGSQRGTFDLTIAGGGRATISSTTAPSPGAVQGGLGGSMDRVSAGELAAGGALVVVAATGTVYAIRRRRPQNHHH